MDELREIDMELRKILINFVYKWVEISEQEDSKIEVHPEKLLRNTEQQINQWHKAEVKKLVDGLPRYDMKYHWEDEEMNRANMEIKENGGYIRIEDLQEEMK